SESIIRREYEPLFLSILDDGGGGPMGEAIRIVCPVKPIRRALFVGELCSARAGYQHEPTSVLGKTLNRECDGRIGNVHNHVNILHVIPLTRHGRAQVGSMLVVSDDHFDGMTKNFASKF